MKFNDYNLVYLSGQTEIRSLKFDDIHLLINLFKQEYISLTEISDNEVIDDICRFVKKDTFYFSAIFIILQNNIFKGYFNVWLDKKIKFKNPEYKKNVFNISYNILDTDNNSISLYIEKSIDALLSFKLKIKTLFSFKIFNKKYIKGYFDNGFQEFDPSFYYSKEIDDKHKTANIFIKKIQ